MFPRTVTVLLVVLLSAQHAAAADVIERVIDALEKRALPLQTKADLEPLLGAIGQRRTVLLGEASHGTRDYYRWRAAITRELVSEHGFRILMVEGDWDAFRPADRYIRDLDGAPASAREALAAMTRWPRWMWANPEVETLLEWLHEFNRDRPPEDRVSIHGMDIYGTAGSASKAPDHLQRLDPDAAAAMRGALACYTPYMDRAQSYLRAIQRGRASCEAPLTGMIERLDSERERYLRADPEAYFHARQNAEVVVRAEKHARTMARRDASSWNARAGHFQQTLDRVRRHEARMRDAAPQTLGVVVWAHNTHVGDGAAVAGRPDEQTLGRHARAALGDEAVFIVGFGSHRGTVMAARSWEGDAEVMPLPEAPEGSLEDMLERAARGDGLWLMDSVAEIPELRSHTVFHRAVGVVYQPELEAERNYVPSLWPRRYDAFLFLGGTTALEELPR